MDIVCHVRVEWIFRELSAAIMRCIPKEKNREEEITCSVLHFEKIRAVHPSVFPVESVKEYVRWMWILQTIPENEKMAQNVFFVWNVSKLVPGRHYKGKFVSV